MLRPTLILLLIVLVCCPSFAQQPVGPTSREIADFAFELIISPADKREQLMVLHPERLTVALRRELIALGNQRFTDAEYTKALNLYQLAKEVSEQIDDKEGVATADNCRQ